MSWLDRLEQRTGFVGPVRRLLAEPIRGGARWAYVFGSALVALVALQVLGGLGLALFYSPSTTTAWASVAHLRTAVPLGALIAAVHHHGASALVVVAGLHLVQVALAGAWRAPREWTWWFGLALLLVTLGFALTGSLLPWDERGYWATRVAVGLAGTAPLVGGAAQRVLVGGRELGNLTLTRFYALHAVVLPLLLVALVAGHVSLVRRHGVTPVGRVDPKDLAARVEPFWPGQAARDGAFALLCVALVFAAALRFGSPFGPPADPSMSAAPRPEWYFRPLFQLLKYFKGPLEPVGTLVIPLGALVLLALLPVLGRGERRGSRGPAGPLVAGGAAVLAALLALSYRDDRRDAGYQRLEAASDARAAKALALAANGVPPEGPVFMLHDQPDERGRRVFEQRCGSCHGEAGTGGKAPSLSGAYSRGWLVALLANPDERRFYGRTKLTGMDGYAALGAEKLGALADFVVGLRDHPAAALPGYAAFKAEGCDACHAVDPGEAAAAPNLAGSGSPAWLRAFIADPGAPVFYGSDNAMPAFKEKLSERELADVAAYVAALGAEPLAPEGGPPPSTDIAFARRCAGCHGADGAGRTPLGRELTLPDFTKPTTLATMSDERVAAVIADGRPGTKMPAWLGKLAPEEIAALARYVRAFASHPP